MPPFNTAAKAVVKEEFKSKLPDTTYSVGKYPYDITGYRQFSMLQMLCIAAVGTVIVEIVTELAIYWLPVIFGVLFVPTFVGYIYWSSCYSKIVRPEHPKLPGEHITKYVTFHDQDLAAQYGNLDKKRKMDIETLYEAYMNGKLSFNGDVMEIWEYRHDFATFKFNLRTHAKFFLTKWVPELLWHSKHQDEDQVTEHYDRGNDFYEAFLGPTMVYTSGIIGNPNERESLETLQENKLRLVCEKVALKPEDRMLDIGCGWGTLAAHAAKTASHVSGVTLSGNQAKFAENRAKEYGVANRVRILHMDYRDIPREKYSKITCLEMAEHVGVRNFPSFLHQVDELLEDDGIFFLQIVGLRRPWQYEDLIWGLFMAKYIFPGADASCPLAWVINQLECAGFDIAHIDCVGLHYSATIERWYRNWVANRERITAKYGVWWFRLWEVFLAWASLIGRQGSANCYQITCHKNLNSFNRGSVIMKKRFAP